MTGAGVARWIWRDVSTHTTRTLVAGFGVATGIAALLFFLALGAGMRQFALGKASEASDATLLEVVPRSMELGLFRLSRPGLLGNAGIDDRTLDKLRRVEGVAAVFPRRLLRLPVMVQGGGGLIGKDLSSDVFVEG